jgi:hypothetical protein
MPAFHVNLFTKMLAARQFAPSMAGVVAENGVMDEDGRQFTNPSTAVLRLGRCAGDGRFPCG